MVDRILDSGLFGFRFDFHEQVDVTVSSLVAPSERAEQTSMFDRNGFERHGNVPY
ncbi:MAG: hypothetical protein WB809_00500 [Thermoplasmata archaeon]